MSILNVKRIITEAKRANTNPLIFIEQKTLYLPSERVDFIEVSLYKELERLTELGGLDTFRGFGVVRRGRIEVPQLGLHHNKNFFKYACEDLSKELSLLINEITVYGQRVFTKPKRKSCPRCNLQFDNQDL